MLSDRACSRPTMSLPASGVRALGRLNVPLYRASRGRRAMNRQYAGFDEYDRRTERDIALFVLEPRWRRASLRPAEARRRTNHDPGASR